MILVAAVAGCGGGSTGMPPAPTSALLADTNRDGVVDDKDVANKDVWSPQAGALFLANLDDDDGDMMADAADEKVNGADDEADLARIQLVAWKDAPSTATATLAVEPALAAAQVRLFRHDATGWSVAAPTLTQADLAAGLELGIEARDFPQKIDAAAWDGYAELHLTVSDGGKAVVDDKVKLRVAPFVMINNLSDVGALWMSTYDDAGGKAFANGVTNLAMLESADANQAVTPDPNGDQWAEDWWQIGVTFIPGASGPHGMLVAQRSAQPDRPAGGFAEQQLGKDVAYIWPHTDSPSGQNDDKGYSMDSFGNHDTIPPYTKGSDSYPLGRIVVGGNADHHIDPTVRAFYDAQRAQPVFQVDTAWLFVGHIDEIVSYVPAQTPRGWKLLVASPKLARKMLQDLVTAGQGQTQMFVGLNWYNDQGKSTPAAIAVADLLADPEIMAANDAAQTNIDADLAALKSEIGLADDEIVEMPFLFERINTGVDYEYVAHMVGTVNLRAIDGALGVPKPHGPMVNGSDYFEKDIQDRVGSLGLKVRFVEDWDDYHTLDGEVHCGTTSAARTMPAARWWEAGR